MNRVLVIGATGNVGGKVVSELAAAGVPVRAMVRRPENARFPAGVEVMRGDLTAPASLDAPLDGVDAVFLVWTAPLAAAAAAVEQIARHARRIVFLTAPIKTPHPFFQQPNPARTLAEHVESLIESSGLEFTFLRPHMFAEDAVGFWGPQIRAGDMVRWPCLETPTAPIDERDIARVGVRALCENGHAAAEYVLTGPESLTQREQIEIIGRALGRKLQIEELTPDQARQELLPQFGIAAVIDMLLNAWAAAAGQPAYVTSTVEEITGTRARSFAHWAADHAPEFRATSSGR